MEAVNATLPDAAASAQNVSGGNGGGVGGAAAMKRKTEWRIMVNVLILIIALLPVAIYEFAVPPTKRGFFCDDHTIQLPYFNNTVNVVMLGMMLALFPVLVVVFVEWMRHRHYGNLGHAKLAVCCCKTPAWLLTAMAVCGHYFISLALALNVMEIAKFSIGRLRPHFIAVCQPQLLDGTTCADVQNHNRYIEDYTCAAVGFTAADVRQARLSFFSGHASLTFHAMVFLTLYLHKRITWQGILLLRPLIQFTLLSIAWFTALSRVMDYWHHWSDVVVGTLLGICSAVLYMWYVMRFFEASASEHKYKLTPHNHTLAILDEVYPTAHQHTIPPAYVDVDTKDFNNLV